MKTFLRLSAFLCTFVGFTNFLNAQGCPTSVNRTCTDPVVTIQLDFDIANCSDAPMPSEVVYSEGDGAPVNSQFTNPFPADRPAATGCVDEGSTISTGYRHNTMGCSGGSNYNLRFNFNHAGGSGIVSCDYSAAGLVLPIELVYFTSELREQTVYLHWQTASEINNEGFFIEHSQDGKEWTALDFIKGNGDSKELNAYDFTDENPVKGITNYYRLRQLDYDGKEEVYRVTSQFIVGEGDGQINVFPNPVSKGEMNVEFHFEDSNETIVRLVDALGRTVLTKEIFVTDKGQRDVLNLSEVSKGNYYLIVQTAFQTYHKQILIQ